MPIVSTTSTITVDGNFSDWTSAERIDNPVNVAGYALYGTVQNDTYYIGIEATSATDPVIGAGTTIWLNTDQNTATGYSPFGSIGADYNVTYVNGAFYLYTGAAAQNLVSATPLTSALSPDGKSLEIAIPRSLLTPASGPGANQHQHRRAGSTPAPPRLFTSRATTPTRNTRSPIPRPCRQRRRLTRSPSSTRTPAPTSISVRPPIPICSWRRRTRPEWPACRMTSSMNRN